MRSGRQLLFVFVVALINVGMVLLGWGDAMSFWHDGKRAVVGGMLAVGPLVMLLLGPSAGSGRREEVAAQRLRVLGGVIVSLPLWYAGVVFCERHGWLLRGDWVGVRELGVALFLCGWCLKLWSIACLGANYSVYITLQSGHTLVTSGPYRWIRHPLYLGFIVWTIGFSLVFRSWLGLVFPLAAGAAAISKLRREERFLFRQMGREFQDYARRTKRLIPFLY